MRDQELIGLYEAYQQVHTQQQVINEEVEIASHYFCEMGLNEIGIEILIEELGVEEFVEFVYDISEDYYLTEARAAKKRTGGKSYAEVKAEIDNKEAAKKKAKDEKRSAAVADAANQQPQRKGILRRVGDAIVAGIDRHNYAMKASEKTASKIAKAATEFGTGLMSSYDNWVGQLISDGYDLSNWTDEGLFEYYEQLCEESEEIGQSKTPGGITHTPGGITPKKKPSSTTINGTPAIPPKPPGTPITSYGESYDIVFDYLISEGYADTNENALAIMANMSEDWRQSIVEVTGRGRIDPIGNASVYGAGVGERNSRTPEDARLRMSPVDRATARANALRKRDDPEATRRANRIYSRFVNPTNRTLDRSMLAATNQKIKTAKRFRQQQQDQAQG